MTPRDSNKFGQWLRDTRASRNLTQRELATKLGIHQPDVSQYENGSHLPESAICAAIAAVFDVEIEFVLLRVSESRMARDLEKARQETVPIKEHAVEIGDCIPDDQLLTVPQAAEILGLTARRVSKLCKDGRIGKRVGEKIYLILGRELKAFMAMPRPPGRPKQMR
jgi:transcriptional regulator with XRE-family HTH domain